MAARDDHPLDDASIDDPWDRLRRLGGALEVIADREDAQKVTEARRLVESLEQRIQEADDGHE